MTLSSPKVTQKERVLLEKDLIGKFDMKNLGYTKYFLEIELSYSSNGILLSQQKYLLDLFQDTGFTHF